MEKTQSDFGFKFMSLMFKLRDLFKPRGRVLKEAGIGSGAQVLDFGCGPGGYILPLSRLIGSYGKIYALDINPQAIQTVKTIVSKKNLTNVETILSDGKTGLPDMSLDYVLLYDVLHHLNQPEDTLAEIYRVLKPEGVLSMSDHHLEDDEIIQTITTPGAFKLLKRDKLVFNFTKVNKEN
jgi:ubiquinone/menaquinone biosynthesis C-methylase UbiE